MSSASRFALPAALSLSLSSLAVTALLAEGAPATPQTPAVTVGDSLAAAPGPRLRPWTETLPPSFGEKFAQRLRREAQGHMDLAAVPPPSAAPGESSPGGLPIDSGSDRRVQRILTRALRGALDEELGALTQRAPFATFLRKGSGRDSLEETATGLLSGTTPDDPKARRFDASLGVRIDAHPRLQLRTRFGSFSGIVEVPVLDPELRVGLERPLGSAGRAALRAGAGGERGDWASLNFAFGF
jgi:hypothetical protein